MILEIIRQGLETIVLFANCCIMLYAFNTFLKKPKESIEGRIVALEVEVKEIKDSLHKGNDRFRTQEVTNEVILHSVLALIEFEMQYCLIEGKLMSEELKQAKTDLNAFLSKSKGELP